MLPGPEYASTLPTDLVRHHHQHFMLTLKHTSVLWLQHSPLERLGSPRHVDVFGTSAVDLQ